jgi:NIMA-interacting peptidyl-prolyl cis-trans isomerase 1
MVNAEDESPLSILETNPPPDPLPDGWIMHKSRSQPGYAYYYNQFTGETKWTLPIVSTLEGLKETIQNLAKQKKDVPADAAAPTGSSGANPTASSSDAKIPSAAKISTGLPSPNSTEEKKRPRSEDAKRQATGTPDKKPRPEQVRVLHILKKHNKCRRPASWRQAKITISREEALEELNEIISILDESKGDAKELRATFEELAKTESDCTSAKRGGDLGFFGRKKMQPNFEKASFALGVGEMSGIVETSSGVHVLLKLG